MNYGRTVFAQLMDVLPMRQFRACVQRYRGDYKVKSFSCLDQFLCMAFAQLTYRRSLRDIETCLRAMQGRLYHMGLRGKVSRSTLADANEQRDWRIYAELAQVLMGIARPLYANEPFGADLDQAAYALDSTTVDLCLSLCPWGDFTRHRSAVKIHTLLDLRGNIPAFVCVTPARVHDVRILDQIALEPGAFYVMDRAYLDFQRLHRIHLAGAFFVSRPRRNAKLRRLYSAQADKEAGIICDQTVALHSFYPLQSYPDKLRRIRYFDEASAKGLTFLTNCFRLPATTIAQLYRCRWQAELFFKWIKQHLRINTFYGTSENSVKTQIWTAVSTYLLVAILKKRLRLDLSLYTILQIVSVTLFEKVPIRQALTTTDYRIEATDNPNQLSLFAL